MAVKSVFDIKCFKDVKFWVEQSVMVERLFLAMPRGCLQIVIVVFPDHTHLLFFYIKIYRKPKTFFEISFPPPLLAGGKGVQQPKNQGPKPIKCLFYQIRN